MLKLGALFLLVAMACANPTTKKALVNTPACANCFTLNNGKTIPAVGLGTFKMGPTDADIVRAIKDGIDVGYRHIDTAAYYQNEKAIGKAVEEVIKEGKVKREDLFITTKVWSNAHTEELALASVKRSLKDLKMDYVDLALVHWPFTYKSGDEWFPLAANGSIMGVDPTKENFEQCYKGLEKAVDQNLAKSIGISNFNIKQIEKIIKSARIKPVALQVEMHPFLSQQDLVDFCDKNDIQVEAYSPLLKGAPELLNHETLKPIATKYSKSVAQVVLRWQIQRGVVVIPKSMKRTRMIENKDIFNFVLTDEEMTAINGLNANNRTNPYPKPHDIKHLPEYPW